MRVLILGASGMAGHVISQYLRERGNDIITLSSNNKFDEHTHIVDAMNKAEMIKFLDSNVFEVVINCIGILIRASEDHKDRAAYLNGYLPHFLENYYQETSTKVIHLSTDCVFSGKNAPYYESSPYDGESFYDRSKALGEISNEKDLTFRMSIVGPDMQERGVGLFNWFMKQEKEISGYTKAIWSGVTTIELAKAIGAAIEQDLTGLYHLVSEKSISKFDLLDTVKEVFDRKDITIQPSDKISVDKTLVNTRKDFNFEVLDYLSMIEEMKAWIMDHSELYKHYGVK